VAEKQTEILVSAPNAYG